MCLDGMKRLKDDKLIKIILNVYLMNDRWYMDEGGGDECD